MAKKYNIGIEVESKSDSRGFRDAAKEAEKLDSLLKNLEKRFKSGAVDAYGRDLDEAARRSEEWLRILGRMDDSLEKTGREADEAAAEFNRYSKELGENEREQKQLLDISKRLASVTDKVSDRTKEQAAATLAAGKIAYKYFGQFSRGVTTLNQARFHSLEMAKAMGILKTETRQGSQEFHQYGAESEQFRRSVRELDNTLSTLTLSIKTLTENLEKSERRMNQGEIAVDALGTEIQDTGDRAYYLNQALFESEQNLYIWQNRAAAAEAKAQALGLEMKEAGRDIEQAGNDIRDAAQDTSKLDNELDDLAQSLNRVDGRLDKMAKGLNKVDRGLEKSKFKAQTFSQTYGNVISDMLEEAAQAIYRFSEDSVKAFYDFDRGTREIFTLIPESSGAMREALQADVLALGTEIGRLPNEMLPAVYNALSAGIPADNVLDAVATASEAARAGVSDLDTTLKLGVAILNAQVGGVSNLEDVYDQLFFTVKNGVITMPELTDVMSQVTSIAGEAGVSMQDISAAMIVMTRQGDSAAEAAELLSIMLTQLSTSGTTLASTFEKAAGKSFRQFIQEGGNLAGAMELLQNHSKRTGQALGDILGGGSPFFRDTQAARGALELTGKHLESLIHFSNEAEYATGSMAEAAAEMGESAELASLQAKAAMEEFKVAAGEALNVGLEPLLRGSTEFFKLWSNNQANRVSNITDRVVEGALETGAYAEAVKRLSNAYKEASTGAGQFLVDQDTRNALMEAGVDILKAVAAESENVEEFQRKLEQLDLSTWTSQSGEQLAVINDMTIRVEEFYDEVQANQMAELLAEDLALVDAKMMQLAENQRTATDAASAYGQELYELSQMGQLAAQTNKEQEQSATFAAEAFQLIKTRIVAFREAAADAADEKLSEALYAQREAALAARTEFNGYALAILNGSEAETNWTDALFQTASQAGINQSQFYQLAMATGEYSEAQIRAALTEAAMKQAVEALSGQLAAGKITVDQAVEALGNFEQALANDYTAELDFSSFADGEVQAGKTKQALKEAEGNYLAKFVTENTTINTTVNRTVNEGSTSQGGGTGDGNPVPLHKGGRFRAGELLMVGDGPGGKFVPGLTEFVIFDQPGEVIGAKESADLFAGQSLPPNFTSTAMTSSFTTMSTSEPSGPLVYFSGDIIINNGQDVDQLLQMIGEKVRQTMEQR